MQLLWKIKLFSEHKGEQFKHLTWSRKCYSKQLHLLYAFFPFDCWQMPFWKQTSKWFAFSRKKKYNRKRLHVLNLTLVIWILLPTALEWMRQKQHSHQETSPLGFGLSYFLWTYFIWNGNPPSYEVSDGLNYRVQGEKYGLVTMGSIRKGIVFL